MSLKRAHALLAYLALEDRPVPREHAAVLLWPDAGTEVGRTRLRRLVYQVEELCGRDLLEAREGCIAIAPGSLACDAVEFRRIARPLVGGGRPAMDLARLQACAFAACEPLMDGLDFGSDTFDDWVATVRVEHRHLLARTLARIAELQKAQGEPQAAGRTLEALLRIDPFCEPAYVLGMAVAAQAGDLGGVETLFTRCADALRAEFGCKPSARTEAAYLRLRAQAAAPPEGDEGLAQDERLEIRFANGPQGTVAYSLLGCGSEAMVVMPGFVSHIELYWEHPGIRRVMRGLARHFTVVMLDRRGLGLSERLAATGTVDAAAADLLTILDAAGIERAWIFGSSEGGPAAIQLAATRPERVRGLVLYGAMAKGCRADDYPWALRAEDYDAWMRSLVQGWGGPANLDVFAPSAAGDPATRAGWARTLRQASSPASLRAVLGGFRDADVRRHLPAIRQPTLVLHRRGDRAVRFAAGEHLARNIPGARFVPLEGDDHWWCAGDPQPVLDAILAFTARGEAA